MPQTESQVVGPGAPRPAAVGMARFIGDLMGSYVLASRAQRPTAVQVFACRARSITAHEAVVNAPVSGARGEALTTTFENLGILRGRIDRLLDGGFAIAFDLSDAERATLAARIEWLKRRSLKSVDDRRVHRRVLPRDPRAKLVVSGGESVECLIIDMSQSGVAISADVLPPLGTPVGVGAVPGKVVRHLASGFAVRFAEVQPLAQIESFLTLQTGAQRHLAVTKLGLDGKPQDEAAQG